MSLLTFGLGISGLAGGSGTTIDVELEAEDSIIVTEEEVPTDTTRDVGAVGGLPHCEAEPGFVRIALKDGTRPEMQINKNMHYKTGFRHKVFTYGMNIRVYGDTNLMVGDLIELKIPEITGTTVEPPEQETYSGNYIVRSIRHLIEKRKDGQGGFEHFMVLDCRRPNLKKALG